jgi:sugar/nucleoside kinase (ribokinase family)
MQKRVRRRTPSATTFAIDTFAAGERWRRGVALALAEGRDVAAADRIASAAAAIERSRAGGGLCTPFRGELPTRRFAARQIAIA